MTEIRTQREIAYIAEAGKIVTACHRGLRKVVAPGISTIEIDAFAEKFIRSCGGVPAQKGYRGYPYATCTSVNDEICHSFPGRYVLKEGDIVKVDMVVDLNGWLADSAWSYAAGKISAEAERLMKITKECLYHGISKAVPGNRTGDIGHAIQALAEKEGFSVVRDYTGHGIGRVMHDGLFVPHYGPAGKGPRLVEGMVLTVEPMLNAGTFRTRLDADGWTARTADGSLSAQYEHTLAITGNGPLILTEQD
jgi:methionyl aminopeptidase